MIKTAVMALISALSVSALAGCNATQQLPAELRPALLSQPSQQQVSELIAGMLNSQSVRLNSNVFMDKSSLVVEPPKMTDANGNPIMGKVLEMPQRFMLMTDGTQCYIRHLNTEQTIAAPQLSCKQ
ncbi:hypothetical protein AAEU32_07875 [Pseudoalteromonas sp. SSDWG2]|uniref:hypothetical protein n=1 Tax=Pseudoalteromonas sp. SSDWG2 TaxID=3139391 RepID=UPI003BAAEF1C